MYSSLPKTNNLSSYDRTSKSISGIYYIKNVSFLMSFYDKTSKYNRNIISIYRRYSYFILSFRCSCKKNISFFYNI